MKVASRLGGKEEEGSGKIKALLCKLNAALSIRSRFNSRENS